MLESWYQAYGFAGAMLLSLVLTLTFFTWIAALSGILAQDKMPRTYRVLLILLLILFPPLSIVYIGFQTLSKYLQDRRARRNFGFTRRIQCAP